MLVVIQGVPLYEFIRKEAVTGPYIVPVPFFNVLNGGCAFWKHDGIPVVHNCTCGSDVFCGGNAYGGGGIPSSAAPLRLSQNISKRREKVEHNKRTGYSMWTN